MDARALAWIAEKGGDAQSDPFDIDGSRFIQVRCGAGHEWRARAHNLAYLHSWCPECYGNKPLTIAAMVAIAESRGGKCLSAEYHGLKGKLSWECTFGHQWDATANNVKNMGSWCPHCRVNVGEELVRTALEEALPGKSFCRTRKELWMEGLELDGYNEELRLAFKYQGKQHFERVEHFQRGADDFEAQLERDAMTVERCQDEFIALLIVPYTVGFTKIRAHVRHELDLLGYALAPTIGTDGEFYDRVRAQGPSTARQYAHITAVIQRKGGVCLSPQYLGYRVPLRIRCGLGHEFAATPEAIDQPAYRGPRFCPECGGTRRKEEAELRTAIESCGYEFLAVESRLLGDRTRRYVKVRCPAAHEYDVLWDNFAPKDGKPKKGCSSCHEHQHAGKYQQVGRGSRRRPNEPLQKWNNCLRMEVWQWTRICVQIRGSEAEEDAMLGMRARQVRSRQWPRTHHALDATERADNAAHLEMPRVRHNLRGISDSPWPQNVHMRHLPKTPNRHN